MLYDLMALNANEHASDQVRAIAALKLEELRGWLATAQSSATEEDERAHLFFVTKQIEQFSERSEGYQRDAPG